MWDLFLERTICCKVYLLLKIKYFFNIVGICYFLDESIVSLGK